jgi:hypothetical protein
MMEWDLGCSISNLYGECDSQFLETIGVKLSKERQDVDKKNYMKLVEEEEGRISGEWENLSSNSSS